ncbi:mucin-2-like [Mytilus edulis]|uniref:mucin-2-like n=1 Tax=Mytilus edulis TaxID=6550 RepID=UPI0039EFB4AB
MAELYNVVTERVPKSGNGSLICEGTVLDDSVCFDHLGHRPHIEVTELPDRSGSNQNRGYLFKATGAVQNTLTNNSYGGIVYSYSTQSLRVWYPPVKDHGKQYLVYLDKLFGKSSTATLAELEITTIVPYVKKCTQWDDWVNSNTPDGSGDYEPFDIVAKHSKLCTNPIKIECLATSGFQADDLGQIITCDLCNGLQCDNVNQFDPSGCADYKIDGTIVESETFVNIKGRDCDECWCSNGTIECYPFTCLSSCQLDETEVEDRTSCTCTCGKTCAYNEFRCDDATCIPIAKQCDGSFDCASFEDEDYCVTPAPTPPPTTVPIPTLTSPSISAVTISRTCQYKGRQYTTGQKWQDGCDYDCTCMDGTSGQYRCAEKCPRYPQIPPNCFLVQDYLNPCCKIPLCSTVAPTPIPIFIIPAPTLTPPPTDVPVTTLKVTSTPPVTINKTCQYKGRQYTTGQKWQDGCDYDCTCMDGTSGQYTCAERCPRYPQIPSHCVLVTDPKDFCCKVPRCNIVAPTAMPPFISPAPTPRPTNVAITTLKLQSTPPVTINTSPAPTPRPTNVAETTLRTQSTPPVTINSHNTQQFDNIKSSSAITRTETSESMILDGRQEQNREDMNDVGTLCQFEFWIYILIGFGSCLVLVLIIWLCWLCLRTNNAKVSDRKQSY